MNFDPSSLVKRYQPSKHSPHSPSPSFTTGDMPEAILLSLLAATGWLSKEYALGEKKLDPNEIKFIIKNQRALFALILDLRWKVAAEENIVKDKSGDKYSF